MATKCIRTHMKMKWSVWSHVFFYTVDSNDATDFTTPEGSTKWCNKYILTDCNI